MPSDFRRLSHQILLDYLARLNAREELERLALGAEWAMVASTLRSLIAELGAKESLSPDQLYRMGLYKRLVEEANAASRRYAGIATEIIKGEQLQFGLEGMNAAEQMLGLSGKFYSHLPQEAVLRMVGITREGTPLYDVLLNRYGENAQAAASILKDSMALGRNPLETARLLGETLDGNVWQSERIARTEQLYVLREVQTESYIESGICSGKDWLAEPDACDECLSLAADSPYDVEEDDLSPHPNCRCGWTPRI